jgi:hypothetical protein
MAGLKGNVAWWAAAKQTGGRVSNSGGGTAPTTAIAKVPFTGGGLQVTRETGNLQETDSSRDQGLTYLVRSGAEGSVEAYVRGSYIHQLLAAALGTDTVSGTTNYTHTITPANVLPYYTFWRNQGDVLWEKFEDCMVSDLTIKGEAGAPLTASATIMGITPTRLASEATATSSLTPTSDAVYNFNDLSATGASISLGGTASVTGATAGQVSGGTASHLIRSFELQISNNVNVQQTDSTVPYDMVGAQRTVNLSFDIILEDLTQYNNFFYGGASGTSVGTSIFTQPMVITLAKDTNNSIAFHLPSVAYEAFPVAPNPNGDPIVVSVRAQAQRFYSTAGAALVTTAIVKNSASAAA